MKKVPAKYLKMNKEKLRDVVIKSRKKYIPKIPSYISRQYEVDELIESGSKCYRVLPKEGFSGSYIIYLYDSGMCRNISGEQWEFIYKLAKKTGSGLFVPMYPLAPESSCRELFNMLTKAYSNFTKGFDVEKVVLLGDGSGAGLALSLAMLAWKEGFRKPDQLVMLSPVIDTEFFDAELENQLKEGSSKYIFYNDTVKDFLNSYWVKDYAVKTEYTSPYYGDYTDLCDDVVVFSGEEDMHSCYAKAFYNKAKKLGVNIRLYQFEDEEYNFIINSKSEIQKNAFEYLADAVCGNFNASIRDLYPIQKLADWSKNYPEVIKDEWAEMFVYKNKFDCSMVDKKFNEYRKHLMLAKLKASDEIVKKFIMKFPKSTIVNVGCRLDNMFQRLDNGKILWYSVDSHNIISARRAMYGEVSREKTIGRRIVDYSWLDDIECNRNQGVLFVFNDALTTFKLPQIKVLFERIRVMFPGAEVAFIACTSDAVNYNNFHRYSVNCFRGRMKMWIDDAQKVLFGWRPDYRIMVEEPVMKYRPNIHAKKLKTRMAIRYNLTTYNHKIIHFKLGSEEYRVSI
ncbi:MAG: alpha/beta hydrolase fold domain-containing protein [Lachnospiraceae bacterium]|nr:alpha/beta hydrolase fold domain-containing protein [Lachnospiraceae bacterium]